MAILKRLIEGNSQFQEIYRKYADKIPSKPRKRVAMITCMDTRLNPIRIFHISVGDAIIFRNAGNKITDDVVRSLAAVISDISEIIILGHTDCSLINTPSIVLNQSSSLLSTALDILSHSHMNAIRGSSDEKKNVQVQVKVLRAHSAIPSTIPIHGLLFNVKSGALKVLVNGYRNLPKIHPVPQSFSFQMPKLRMPSISLSQLKKSGKS
ncbi:MAG: beta-class carbonic anhydrase [Candidatus Helarchaeota archaeon]